MALSNKQRDEQGFYAYGWMCYVLALVVVALTGQPVTWGLVLAIALVATALIFARWGLISWFNRIDVRKRQEANRLSEEQEELDRLHRGY